MTERLNIAPTKSNQLRIKRELEMASDGYQLLEQKREILVMELMRLLDQVKAVQKEMELRQQKAYATLRRALALNGYNEMHRIAEGIQYNHDIVAETRVIAGVRVPELKMSQGKFHSQFGFVGTDSQVDQTMEDFLALAETVGHLAELETAVWLLARELRKTQRRVNALDSIFLPQYRKTLHFIEESLESKELDSFFTLKMVKKKTQGE